MVAGLGRPGVPQLCPVVILEELWRRGGDSSWRRAFAVALIGAPAELRQPVPSCPFLGHGPAVSEEADRQPLLQRDLDNGWIVPAVLGASVPSSSPVTTVEKASGQTMCN